jgi:predicted transcriptional regulator
MRNAAFFVLPINIEHFSVYIVNFTISLKIIVFSQMEQALKAQTSQETELRSAISELKSRQDEVANTLKIAEQQAKALADIGQKAKSEIVTSLEDMVESELVCAICSELFIQVSAIQVNYVMLFF